MIYSKDQDISEYFRFDHLARGHSTRYRQGGSGGFLTRCCGAKANFWNSMRQDNSDFFLFLSLDSSLYCNMMAVIS